MSTIDVDGIVIEVVRKRMKSMTLRVCPPQGEVKISAPLRSSDTLIRRFAASHIAWIHQHRLSYEQARIEQTQQYITGERHYLHGREYILRVHERIGRAQVLISEDTFLDLYVPYGSTEEQRKNIIQNQYRAQLQALIQELTPKWERIIGKKALAYQIRRMQTRWGSCNPRTQKITLSLELIKHPVICLEYVIVHELVHLIEGSHNARFKALMDTFMPGWRTYKAALHEGC